MTSIAGSWIFLIHAWQIYLCVDLSYGNDAGEQLYSAPNRRDWQLEEPDYSLRHINEGYFGTRELSYGKHNTHRSFRGLKEFFLGRRKGSKSSYRDEDDSDSRPIVSTAPNPTVVQDQEEDNWYTRQKRKLLLQNYDGEELSKEEQKISADTMKNQPKLTTNSKQLQKPTTSPDKPEEDWITRRKRLWHMESDENSERSTGNQKTPPSNDEQAKPNYGNNRPPIDDKKPAIPRLVNEQIPLKANDQENKRILDDNQKPQPIDDKKPNSGDQITLRANAQMLPSVNDQKPLLVNEKVSPTTKVEQKPSHLDDQKLLTLGDKKILTSEDHKHLLEDDEKPQPIDDQKLPLPLVLIDQTPPSTDSITLPNANNQKPLLDNEKISPVKTIPDSTPSHVDDQKLPPVDDSKLLTLEDNKRLLETDHTPTSIMNNKIQSSLENRGTAMKLDASTQKQSTVPETSSNPSILNDNKDKGSPNTKAKRVTFDLPETNKQPTIEEKSEKVAEERVDSTHNDDKPSRKFPELTDQKPFNSETNYLPKTTTKEMEKNLVVNPKLDMSVDTAKEETDELHKIEVDYIDETSQKRQKETNEYKLSNSFDGDHIPSTNDNINPKNINEQHSPLLDNQNTPILNYIPTLSNPIEAEIEAIEQPRSSKDSLPQSEPVSDPMSNSFAGDHTPSTNDINPKDFDRQHSPLQDNKKSPLLNYIPTLSNPIGAEIEPTEQPRGSEDSLPQFEPVIDPMSHSFTGDHTPLTNDDINPKDFDKQHSPLQDNQKSPLLNEIHTLSNPIGTKIEATEQPRSSDDSLQQSEPVSDPMSNVKYKSLTTPSTNTAQIRRGRPEVRRLPQRPRTISGTADEHDKPVSVSLKREPSRQSYRLTSSRRDPIPMDNEKTPTLHSTNSPAINGARPRARPPTTRSKEIDALAEEHNKPLSNEVARLPKAQTLSPLPSKGILKRATPINHPFTAAEEETRTTQYPNDVPRTRPRPQVRPISPRPITDGTYSPRRPTRLGEKRPTSQINQDNEDKGSPNKKTKRVAFDLPETNKHTATDGKIEGVSEERVEKTNNDDLPSQRSPVLTEPKLKVDDSSQESPELTEPKPTNSETNKIASPKSEASIVLPHPRRKPGSQRPSNTNHSPGETNKSDSDSSIVLPHPRRKPGTSRASDSNQAPTEAQSVPVSKLKVERKQLSHPIEGPTGFPQRRVPTKNVVSPSSRKSKSLGFSSALKKIGNFFRRKKEKPNLSNEISYGKPSSVRPPRGPGRTSDQSIPRPRRTISPNNNNNESVRPGTRKPPGPTGNTNLPARQSSGRYNPPARKPQPSRPGGKTDNVPQENTAKAGSSNERGTLDRSRTRPPHAERPTDRPRIPPPIKAQTPNDISRVDTKFSPVPRKPQSPVPGRKELQKRPPSPHTPSRTTSEPEKEPQRSTDSSQSDTSSSLEPRKPHNPVTNTKELQEIPHTPQTANSESRTSQEPEKEPQRPNKLSVEDISSSPEPREPNSPVPAEKQAPNERHTLLQNLNSESITTGEPEKEPQRSNSLSEVHNASPKLRKQPSQRKEPQKRPLSPQRPPAKARTSPVPERMNTLDKQHDRTDEQPTGRILDTQMPQKKENHKHKGFFSSVGAQLKAALKKSHSSEPKQSNGSPPMSRAERKELPLRQPSHQSPQKEKKKSGGFFSSLGTKMKKALHIHSSKPINPDGETNVLPKRPIQQNTPQIRESRKPQPTRSRPTGSQPTGPRTPRTRPTGPRKPGPRPTGPRPTGPRPTGPLPTGSRTASYRPAELQQTGARQLKPRPSGH